MYETRDYMGATYRDAVDALDMDAMPRHQLARILLQPPLLASRTTQTFRRAVSENGNV